MHDIERNVNDTPGGPQVSLDDAVAVDRMPGPAKAPGFAAWLGEGVRAALFMRPRLERMTAHPAWACVPVGLSVAVGVVLQRLMVPGDVVFDPRALGVGWLGTLLIAWLCWLVLNGMPGVAARAFNLLATKELCIALPMMALYVAAVRLAVAVDASAAWHWSVFVGWLGWSVLSGVLLLWRLAPPRPARRVLALAGFVAVGAAIWWSPGATYWVAPDLSGDEVSDAAGDDAGAEGEEAADEAPPLALTQPVIEAQAQTVAAQFAALAPQRQGTVDLYAISFAPFADEDVFSREADLVDGVMRSRFDADGRTLRLVNHARRVADTPWATPQNLERAIHAAAARMDRDEDVLFLHLTSHGARDGQLAASFWPLTVEPVTPQQLRTWLDDAGVRYRVVSISACYSGSWIPALAEPGTLVMTAADAEHTSYGCGRLSELTFFGRALYDEQLRTETRSFEAAHAASRLVIDQREREAGKSDGYSNPQIATGEAVRRRLAALQQRLEAAPTAR